MKEKLQQIVDRLNKDYPEIKATLLDLTSDNPAKDMGYKIALDTSTLRHLPYSAPLSWDEIASLNNRINGE